MKLQRTDIVHWYWNDGSNTCYEWIEGSSMIDVWPQGSFNQTPEPGGIDLELIGQAHVAEWTSEMVCTMLQAHEDGKFDHIDDYYTDWEL